MKPTHQGVEKSSKILKTFCGRHDGREEEHFRFAIIYSVFLQSLLASLCWSYRLPILLGWGTWPLSFFSTWIYRKLQVKQETLTLHEHLVSPPINGMSKNCSSKFVSLCCLVCKRRAAASLTFEFVLVLLCRCFSFVVYLYAFID